MIREHENLIKETVRLYKHLYRMQEKADKIFGSCCGSPLLDPFWQLFDKYVELVEANIGDEHRMLSWYIIENECGKVDLSAWLHGKSIDVQTVKDLIKVIDEFSQIEE